jgi:hypothetical protein
VSTSAGACHVAPRLASQQTGSGKSGSKLPQSKAVHRMPMVKLFRNHREKPALDLIIYTKIESG